MPGPPHVILARRAARRAQLRRRRVSAAGLLALVVALIVVVLQASSSSVVRPRTGGSPQAGSGQGDLGAGNAGNAGNPPSPRRQSGTREVQRLARLGLPVYCAGPRSNAVALTFDDGPGPYTHLALKKLHQAHQRATFFAVGRSIDNFPGYLVRELRLAALGDHTYTHPLLTALPGNAARSEIERTAQKIAAQSGEAVRLFRPPYGAHNPTIDQIVRRQGLLEILWNVDSADSLGASWAGIIRNVEAGMHPGSIILMHENRGQTIRALTTLLPELHRRHLRSVTVPELLASDPLTATQLKAGAAGCRHRVVHGGGA